MTSDNDIVTIIVPDNFRVKADGGLEEYWESQRSNHKMAMHLHVAKPMRLVATSLSHLDKTNFNCVLLD